MKSLFLSAILIFGGVFSIPANADSNKNTAIEAFERLVQKESRIEAYQGIHYSVVALSGRQPIIAGSYLVVRDADSNKNSGKATPIFILGDALSKTERLEADQYNVAFRSAQMTSISLRNDSRDGEEQDNCSPVATRFDFSDKSGTRWLSRWFDSRGFERKIASYDANGNLRLLEFFSNFFYGDQPSGRLKNFQTRFFKYSDLSSSDLADSESGRPLDLKKIRDIQILGKRLVGKSLPALDKNRFREDWDFGEERN